MMQIVYEMCEEKTGDEPEENLLRGAAFSGVGAVIGANFFLEMSDTGVDGDDWSVVDLDTTVVEELGETWLLLSTSFFLAFAVLIAVILAA